MNEVQSIQILHQPAALCLAPSSSLSTASRVLLIPVQQEPMLLGDLGTSHILDRNKECSALGFPQKCHSGLGCKQYIDLWDSVVSGHHNHNTSWRKTFKILLWKIMYRYTRNILIISQSFYICVLPDNSCWISLHTPRFY